MLHYNFPPFSTGETKPLRGASRREVGHGNLAERAIARVLPSEKDFPYTIRIVSEILESNGSSSMASVLRRHPVRDGRRAFRSRRRSAGIAMGLIKEGDRVAVLSDILGDEDHLGDMDFKICGSKQGVTAVQMDIKIQGLTREILETALRQAREGRFTSWARWPRRWPRRARICRARAAHPHAAGQARPDPRDHRPGGKTIRGITAQTGVAIEVEDDGTVHIASPDGIAVKKAIDIIKGLTTEPEVGEFYMGVVKRLAEFGAFVEILPGTDGLVHISELDAQRVRVVQDICKEGDEMLVKVIGIDRATGKIRLSRREALGKTPDVIHNFRTAAAS
jgi:polyribonucleotide nucleotidyltransferase